MEGEVMIANRVLALAVASVVSCLNVVASASAQTYPVRPITMIIPFPAGGNADPVGRILAERMRVSLGQPVVIENIAGANGSIGTGRVARASPDGYTLGLGFWNTLVANGAIYTLPYNVLTDFEPVALLVTTPLVIVAKKAMPANDLKELIAWLKANPGDAAQGSVGVGSQGHLAGILFQRATGTRFQHVPYRGSAPAMQDLLAGQIDILIDAPVTSLPQMRAGRIKVLAVFASRRLTSAPDIPTVDEAGLPGVYLQNWTAFLVPKRTPKQIVARLNAAAVDALADPAVRQRLTDLGVEIAPRDQQTPDALAAFQKAEIEKWWPIIKEAGIRAE
jgi:tripartite-type tricarboxylate transporter receptor subunit TctC